MSERILIWGASSQALVVADILRLSSGHEITAFADTVNPGRAGTEFCGAPVLTTEEQIWDVLRQGTRLLIVAVGANRARVRLAQSALEMGYNLATAVDPSAIVSASSVIGAGTVVMAGALVSSAVTVGRNVVLANGANVSHECTIEDGAFISAGANLGGLVCVGKAATVEIGATVARGLRVGAGSVIGAGSVVLDSVPDNVLAYGTPARIVREITDYGY